MLPMPHRNPTVKPPLGTYYVAFLELIILSWNGKPYIFKIEYILRVTVTR